DVLTTNVTSGLEDFLPVARGAEGRNAMQLLPNNRQDHIKVDDSAEVGAISALMRTIRILKNAHRELARRISPRRRCRIERGTRRAAGQKGAAGGSDP